MNDLVITREGFDRLNEQLERLKGEGVSDAALARIHAPIGLDIGAVSPSEIAVAIMGEITARLRKSPEKAA